MRCSCGQHDLEGDGPYKTCHFCGHATNSQPVVVWSTGKLYFSICHACSLKVEFEDLSISVHVAPPELVAKAQFFDDPLNMRPLNHEVRQA